MPLHEIKTKEQLNILRYITHIITELIIIYTLYFQIEQSYEAKKNNQAEHRENHKR